MTAETYLNKLKLAVNSVWESYGDASLIKKLIYAEKEYGAMQRGELEEITKMIEHLKDRVDYLSDECMYIPADKSCSGCLDNNKDGELA